MISRESGVWRGGGCRCLRARQYCKTGPLKRKRMRRKILHVIGRMGRGGVEVWLMHIMRNINKANFEFHFLVHTNVESAFDREILSLGGQIHYGANPRNILRYAADFAGIVRNHGPFDVVHSHVYWYSGFVLRLAHDAGIPIRIAHSHQTVTNGSAWKIHRQLYESLMRAWIMRYATHRIGVSQQAGEALFGRRPERPFTLLYYGFDFTRFLEPGPSDLVKRQLGIPSGRKVVGQIGRFVHFKNHAFTVEFFAHTIAGGMDAHLLLVGEGSLVPTIRAQIESRGLSDRCTFAGEQSDVAPFFSAMDVSVFPSHYEGLGIAAVESQAAGVPVIASTGVPAEVDVIPQLVEHVPLSAGAAGWASAVDRRLRDPKRRRGNEALLLQNSRFGLRTCLEALSCIYLDNLN